MMRHTTRLLPALLLAVLLTTATGCTDSTPSAKEAPGTPPATTATTATTATPSRTYSAAPPVGNLSEYEHMQAVIETERGNVIIHFYPHEAPHTVASFVKLAQDGFYNGLTFHRVEPGFVVQGGDPSGDGSGGPGFTLPAEFNSHKHVEGAVAMARTSDPNSAGSQFYICLAPVSQLDGQYTVFGQVTAGMDAVQKIHVGDHMLRIRIEPIK